jgi:hypothetical protein
VAEHVGAGDPEPMRLALATLVPDDPPPPASANIAD